MSKTHHLRAATALAALALTFSLGAPDRIESALAAAAPAPAAAGVPNIVVARPPATGPAIAAPTAALPPAIPAPSAAVGAPGPAAGGAVPRIIVIGREDIMRGSSAGQDIMNQSQQLMNAASTQFKAEEQQLVTEAGQLQQQLAIMAPDVRDQKEKEFQTKQQNFQSRVNQRQQEITAGYNKAARQIEIALDPILKAIMVEKNANIVLDRQAAIVIPPDWDVTPIAVQRLNRALPHVKVELTPVAANAAAAPARPTITPPPAPATAARK